MKPNRASQGWTPPSLEKAEKLPQINVEQCDLVQKYLDWFNANKGISRTVPPLYKDFTIKFSRSYNGVVHNYIEIVHYFDDLCGFDACHVIDGKKVMTVRSNYADYVDSTIKLSASVPVQTKYTNDWLKNEATAVGCTVIAVQMYILYHRPELVPVEIVPDTRRASPKKSSTHNSTQRPVRKISDKKRVIIRLSASDPEPRRINYRSIQWQVRGHYRHLQNGKIIYIKPHLAKRGWKKNAAPKIEIE